MRHSRAFALTMAVGTLLMLVSAVEAGTPACGSDQTASESPIVVPALDVELGFEPVAAAGGVCGAVAVCDDGSDVSCLGFGQVGIDCFPIHGCYAYCSGSFTWCRDADRESCPTP